jgi:sugar O-acyltransferase (sialic acid O-acetyltransferase NeuD family)
LGRDIVAPGILAVVAAQRVVVVGAGGFGREVLDVIEASNVDEPCFCFLGFIDDIEPNQELLDRRRARWLGTVEEMDSIDSVYVLGIGNPQVRRVVDARLWGRAKPCPVLWHPKSSCGSDVDLGHGSVVTAGARLTTNIRAGRHVHVHVNATIGHDCVIGDHVTISPGATVSGNVVLEDEVMLGTGANVIQGVRIGRGAIIGAGAVVVSDVPDGATVTGVPGRLIKP